MKQKLSYGLMFCLLAVLAGYTFATVGGWNITSPPNERWFSGSIGDPAWNWMKDVDKLVTLGANPGTGKIWYVDSGVTTEGSGNSWESAYRTIEEAVDASLADGGASRGDYIMVAQGHAETFITESLDVDVIGITIIGLGNGSLAPTITYTHADGEIAVGVDNVTIKNLRLLCSITGVKIAIDIEAGADYCTIDGCTFWEVGDATGTDEFLDAVYIGNACIGTTIQNCTFRAEAAGAASAITTDNDTAFTTIRNNIIVGDYSVACVEMATVASTDVLILSNIMVNGDLVADSGLNAVATINLVDATAGLIIDNYMAADTATDIMRAAIADDVVFIENFVTDDDGDEYEGSVRSSTTAVTKSEDG